ADKMDVQKSEDTSGSDKPNPTLIDLGTFFVDSDIIFGFTSHLLRRKAKVDGISSAESSSCSSSEPSPRQRRYGSRPQPEGARAVSITETDRNDVTKATDLCKQCQVTVAELKRQALALTEPTSLQDPGFATFLFDQLQVPDWPVQGGHETSRCPVCATSVQQLRQQALQALQDLCPGTELATVPALPSKTFPGQPTRVTTHGMLTLSSRPPASKIPHPAHSMLPVAEQRRGVGWASNTKPSVQVTVGGNALSGTLSSVTIQAQQYLEGMWSISRVNNFLPQPSPTHGPVVEADQPAQLSDTTATSVSINTSRQRSPVQFGPAVTLSSSQPTSTTTSFFIRKETQVFILCGEEHMGRRGRAAQKLNLSSKRKKTQPPMLQPPEPSIYPTNFSSILQLSPPPAPPCLLRASSKAKENPGMGKVKVMVRICPSVGVQDSSESMSFLKVDQRKKQLTLYEPSLLTQPSSGHRRTPLAAPKMFAFDAVFTQDASQAEVCSGTVAEIIQSVVNGADGCIFSFGHVKLGKTYTMIGKDSSSQSLGIAPCAISWLFKLISERREKTGTRFSVRVSAVEIYGKEEGLQDLLSDVSTGSLQDGQSPGVYLREDPICGTQLQNHSELRAPTAEKAAFFLDAALSARSTSHPDTDEEDRRNSHMLFTLHIYQYRMEKSGKGGMSGGRSRLHLIDLGSCEKVLSKSRDGGGGLCLSLTALGNVILALTNGAKHVPYRDSKLTMLLRDSLGNINCRTTMLAHVSDSPGHYADSLTTIQLASRIHRMRKKKSKYASSSSGGESSCDEGRIRRPPHLRPFHPRTVALDPDLPSLLSDPDYSSSSEQSCDTVIYVGPGGATISDRELSDNEGPPAFVPIIPSLNRKQRGKEGPPDRDHFKCNTFAELQERLECIDGSKPVLSRENSGASLGGKSSKSVSKFGSPVATSSPNTTSPNPCVNQFNMGKNGPIKNSLNARPVPVNGNKARTLSASNSKALSSSTKSLTTSTARNASLPPSGKSALPRAGVGCNGKSTRGTIMGTKQAMRATNSRVGELASGIPSGKQPKGSGDSDSGNDSGVNLNDDKHTPIPILPSPYSKITAPRRPQRYSSGHGSDNSSVLSGELPPAMGRTALFYHSGGSSGYESMIRDSEATGSASSALDSMSESGMSSNMRLRSSKPPKKRSNGIQRRRLIPAPLPDTSSLGMKAGATGQWVDLPPIAGPLKEPFEIKVYEIDDVERLQRRRQEQPTEQSIQDVDKGLLHFNTKLKDAERRQQQIRDLRMKHGTLKEELEDTKARLMMDPRKWIGEFEVDQDLDPESQEYLEALEQVTSELEYCVNLCKSRVMMVTCFDIRVASEIQEGPREVEV
ncbi:hypothetical protein QTP70_033118, partial [Hemibagrus guttatus]